MIKQNKNIKIKGVKTAILEIKTQINDNCSSFDPFGLCTVQDCLQCKNCAYSLKFDNGQIIEKNDFNNYPMTSESDRYLLEFITPITEDVFDYLVNEKNDYRVIRIKDQVIMRYSKKEQKRLFNSTYKNINNERLVLRKVEK